jgi:hypothetical protein
MVNDKTDSPIDQTVRDAAVAAIKAKAKALIAEREEIRQEIAELNHALRRKEIAIFDCRGAARLFNADIDLPEDLATARAVWVRRVMDDGPPRPPISPRPPAAPQTPSLFLDSFATAGTTAGREAAARWLGTMPRSEPSVREIAIEQLKRAGVAGAKASTIRQVAESILKKKFHEKTAGMTLYRLSKDGLARREGQTWFFVPPKAETKNPGG